MRDRLIVALDTDSAEGALAIARAVSCEAKVAKVGMELFPRGGPALVRSIREAGMDVFLDLKFCDIPNTVAGAVRSAAALGVRFTTVHASGGRAMLRAAAEAARGTGTTVLAVTVLTSLDDSDLAEIGYASGAADVVGRLTRIALEEGIGGIVCSPAEAAAVRRAAGDGAVIVTPGVRLPEDDRGDQKRVLSPDEAAAAGADFIVVGRPVTRAADPGAAARRFAELFSRGFSTRGRPG